MNNLIVIQNNTILTSSEIIAEGVGNQHKSVIELVRKYQSDLEEFGGVTFETRPFETKGGVQETRNMTNLTALSNITHSDVTHMTLKEITDLLEVRHDKSMLKVEEMAKEPEFGSMSKMDIQYSSGKGRIDYENLVSNNFR